MKYCSTTWFLLIAPYLQLAAGPIDEAQRIELENGLEVVLIPHRASPVVALTTIVYSGVRNETAERSGASHFLEHLLFNGTTSRSQKELYDETDFYGIYNNAATRDDYTVFMMLVGREHLAKAINIQADMLLHSTLPQEKFEKERNIVLEEIARDAGRTNYRVEQFHRSRAYSGTPYSRPALGTPESLKKITRSQVWSYYRQYYQPNNMSLMVMGDFERESLLALILKEFGKVRRGGKPLKPQAVRISWNGGMLVENFSPGMARQYLEVSFPCPRPGEDGFAGISALASILSGRLQERFVMGKSTGVELVSLGLDYNRDLSTLRLSVRFGKDADAAALTKKILADLRHPDSYTATPPELQSLRKELVAEEIYLSEKVHYYTFMKAGAMAAGRLEFLQGYVPSLNAVEPSQLSALGRKYLSSAPFRATLTRGAESGTGGKPRVVTDFKIDAEGKPLIAEVETVAPLETVRRTLPGGLTVLFRQSPGSKVFAAHLLAKNRCTAEPRGKGGIADFLHRLLPKGSKHRSEKVISQELAAISGRLKVTDSRMIPFDNYYFSPQYSYIRLETLEVRYARGLFLLADMIRYPKLDEAEIVKLKKQVKSELSRDAHSTRDRARHEMYRQLFGEHPLARPIAGTSESVERIRRGTLVKFHRSYFSPANLVLTIISGRSAGEVLPIVAQAFSGFEGGKEAKPLPAFKLKNVRPGLTRLPSTGSPQAQVLLGQRVDLSKKERVAVVLLESLLSDRLVFQLREKEGLAYSVGCGFSFSGSGGYFIAGMGTRPQNVDKAISGLRREIRAFRDEEIKQYDLDRVRNRLIHRLRMRRLTSIGQAYYLGLQEFRGLPLDHEEKWLEAVKSVTTREVQALSKKILEPGRAAVVVAD